MHSFYDYMPTRPYSGNYTSSGPLSYQTGGQPSNYMDALMAAGPKQEDYPDYESWAAAMDEFISQASEEQAAPDQAIPVPAAFSNKFKLNPYKGVSVADFLSAQGKASGLKSRKKLAEKLGISGYSGTASENKQMMEMIQQNPDVLNDYASASGYTAPRNYRKATPKAVENLQNADAEYSDYDQNTQVIPFAQQAPGVAAPSMFSPSIGGGGGGSQYASNNSGSGWMLPAAAVAAGTAAGLYGLAPGALKNAKSAAAFAKADVKAADIIAMAKAKGREAETFQLLQQRGMKPAEIGKALKDIKFNKPEAETKLLKQLGESTQKGINQLAKTAESEAAGLKQAQRLVQIMKDNGGVRDQELVQKVFQLVKNPAKANKLLEGLSFPKAAAQVAPTVARTAGLGTRLAEGLKGVGKSSEFMKALGEGWGAIKGLMPKEEGGGVGNQYGGAYTQGGNDYMAYGGYHSEIPRLFNQPVDRMNKAMYGMGMAQGGQMPQWLAERRFAAAGNQDKMSQYGYEEGGEYEVGWEGNLSKKEIERLKQMGYQIEAI